LETESRDISTVVFSKTLLLLHVRELVVVAPIHLEALIENELKSGPRLLARGKREEVVPTLLHNFDELVDVFSAMLLLK
jgi:hypothetical protein